MKRYNGRTEVEGGYYFNPRKWSIAVVSGDRGTLEGSAEDEFLRVPLLVMLPLALAVSGLFVVFLPFIGFGLVAHVIAKKVMATGKAVVSEGLTTLTPAMQVGEAHLTGKEPGQGEGKVESESLAELKDEIAERRARETDDDECSPR